MENTNETFIIIIGGDLFPSENNVELFVSGYSNQLFDDRILNLFQNANYSICNLEGVLSDSEYPIKKVDPVIKAPKAAWNGYKQLKLSSVTLANNHVFDYGVRGYQDTIEVLINNNVDFFGAGIKNQMSNSRSVNANGKIVTIYSVSETMFNIPDHERPGANIYDEYIVCDEIKQLKKNCDYLIVIYHGGTEFYWYGSDWLRTRFHRMADCGADLITAQHTHCIGLQEQYNNSYLLYGQGDFLFARRINPYREFGLLLEIQVSDEIKIIRHLIHHQDNRVEYDAGQNFSQFDERSKEYSEGETFAKEYTEFSTNKMFMFLEAFRGKNFSDRIAKKILSKDKYKERLLRKYSEKQLLRIISGIQFEEYRESLINGLWNSVSKE